MLACSRRDDWCAYISSGGGGEKPPTEWSYLLPHSSEQQQKDDDDDTAETKDGAIKYFGYLKTLNRHHGTRFLLVVFLYEHVLKGFIYQLFHLALPYVYKAYNVPATKVLIFSTIVNSPWAMRPLLCLMSDIFPIGFYSKLPYILVTALIAAASYAVVSFLPHDNLHLVWLVVFMGGAILQIAATDSLFHKGIKDKIKSGFSASKGSELVTSVTLGTEIIGFVGVFLSGFILMSSGYRAVYIIAFLFALCSIGMVAMNCHGEKAVTSETSTKMRQWFWEHQEVCVLALMLACLNSVLVVVVLASRDMIAVGVVAIFVVLTVFFGCVLALSPVIAAVLVVSIIQTAVHMKVESAAFYFNTDTLAEFPNGPHFSKFFFNTVLGSVAFGAELLGLLTFLRFSPTWTCRSWLIMASFVASLGNVLYLLYFSRAVSVIPDWIWLILTYVVHYTAEKWKFMPFVASFACSVPKDMEVIGIGLLVGIISLVDNCGSAFSAWFLDSLACSPRGLPNEGDEFQNLWMVPLWNAIVPLVSLLLFVGLIPDASPGTNLLERDGCDFSTNCMWSRLPASRFGAWCGSRSQQED